MRDYNEIERVLRRVEFGKSAEHDLMQARGILLDVGYTFHTEMDGPRFVYTIDIGEHSVLFHASAHSVIDFARKLCADYQRRDIAMLAEYVKTTGYFAMKSFGDTMKNFVAEWKENNPGHYAESFNGTPDYEEDDACSCSESDCDSGNETICCGEQIEALSDRIERLERAAKDKAVSSVTPISEARSTWPSGFGSSWRTDAYAKALGIKQSISDKYQSINDYADGFSSDGDGDLSYFIDGTKCTKQEFDSKWAGKSAAKSGNELKAQVAERIAIIDYIRSRKDEAIRRIQKSDNISANDYNFDLACALLTLIDGIKAGKHNG